MFFIELLIETMIPGELLSLQNKQCLCGMLGLPFLLCITLEYQLHCSIVDLVVVMNAPNYYLLPHKIFTVIIRAQSKWFKNPFSKREWTKCGRSLSKRTYGDHYNFFLRVISSNSGWCGTERSKVRTMDLFSTSRRRQKRKKNCCKSDPVDYCKVSSGSSPPLGLNIDGWPDVIFWKSPLRKIFKIKKLPSFHPEKIRPGPVWPNFRPRFSIWDEEWKITLLELAPGHAWTFMNSAPWRK